MKCSQVRRLLSAFTDGEGLDRDKALVSRHLDSCPSCRQELERLTRIRGELGRLAEVEVRPYFATRVKQRIADRQAGRHAPGRRRRILTRVALPAGALAVIALTALGGSYLGRMVYRWRQPTSTMTRTSPFVDPAGGTMISVAEQLFPGGNGE